MSKYIIGNLGTKMVSTPARSSDIDTKKNITKVIFDQFSVRVSYIIVNVDQKAIKSLIGSKDKVKKGVIRAERHRNKY